MMIKPAGGGVWQRQVRVICGCFGQADLRLNFRACCPKRRAWTRMVLSSTELPHSGRQPGGSLIGTRQHRRQAKCDLPAPASFFGVRPQPPNARAAANPFTVFGIAAVIDGHRHRSGYRVEGQGRCCRCRRGKTAPVPVGLLRQLLLVGVGASIPVLQLILLSFQLFERKHPFLCFFPCAPSKVEG